MSNSVTLVGTLVEDPELRFTAGGVAMANIRFAVNHGYRTRDGQWKDEDASFFGGTVWRDLAENVAESLGKGDQVIVKGRMKQEFWENNDGEKRSKIVVSIDDIGASLRFATASLSKTNRTAAAGNYGGGNATPAAPVARTDFGPDEAPF